MSVEPVKGVMRDVFIETLTARMKNDDTIYFVTADFGSPRLDALIEQFPERFLNVGIAEQNLVNISVGLALEGFKVFAYAIAPFITMRCCEQIRVSLGILSQVRPMNVTLIGVGAGFSYDVSGPTHQALEDLSIMRTIPNVQLLSPADWIMARASVDYCLENHSARYIRMDGKPVPAIYGKQVTPSFECGARELKRGSGICLVGTGYMTHKALSAADLLASDGISAGVVDAYMLNPCSGLDGILSRYKTILTIEEGFTGSGGLDALVLNTVNKAGTGAKVVSLGLDARYGFDIGPRDELLRLRGLDEASIAARARKALSLPS